MGLVTTNPIRVNGPFMAASKSGDKSALCATLAPIVQQPRANKATSRHDNSCSLRLSGQGTPPKQKKDILDWDAVISTSGKALWMASAFHAVNGRKTALSGDITSPPASRSRTALLNHSTGASATSASTSIGSQGTPKPSTASKHGEVTTIAIDSQNDPPAALVLVDPSNGASGENVAIA